jgi:serine/threonine-protein kinase
VLDDKYRLEERLGEGGMGAVYRATHLLIERPVAVKVLNARLVTDEAARERFRREARAAGRLQHTNAVAVTDFGETHDGLVYIVMELLEGRTLRGVLAREGPLEAARAVSLMLQVSAAVGTAHDAGIIHRDLKPANIFVVQRSNAPHIVKVLDFGIAKLGDASGNFHDTLTGAGVIIGTPRYMSPEQCEGAPLTPASDVYSIGVILYETLTGRTPFTGSTPLSLALKHASEQPLPPREIVASIPPALEEVVLHALEKEPEKRPANAGAFRRELFEVAGRLGLEHSAGFSAPTVEMLREAGTTTPSGRLIIDMDRVRRSRAMPSTGESPLVATTAEGEVASTGGGAAARVDASPSPVMSNDVEAPSERASAQSGGSWFEWLRQPPVIVGAVLVVLLLLSASYAVWRGGRSPAVGSESSRLSDGNEAIGRSISQAESAPRGTAYPSPQTAAEFFENGTYYFSIKGYDAALRDFRRAVELQPEFPSAHNRLGRTLMMKGQFGPAADSFRTAIKQQGGNYPTAQYNLGFALQSQGELDSAVTAYREAIKNRGDNYPDAYFQVGAILRNFPARRPEAIAALRKAVEQSGGRDADAHLVLGVTLAEEKDFADAEKSMQEAIKQRGGDYPYAHYNLARLYETTERTADAISEYEKFLEQAPTDSNRPAVENTLKNLRRK